MPARPPILISKPTTMTTSFGGTICTSCGFDSQCSSVNFTSMISAQASVIACMARSMILVTRRSSMAVRGRCGMKRSEFEPPRRRSMTG